MHRRDLILKAMSGAALVPFALRGSSFAAASALATDWRPLERALGDRLIAVSSPLDACARANGAGAEALFVKCRNPYFLGDEPGLTQTLGWVDAWTSRASVRAVVAKSPADIAAAVLFARKNGLKLVVKGGGHSYFGNSNAAGSLLIWTRRMRAVELHDDFVGVGCQPNTAPVSAVSIGAGAIWGQVYDAVSVKGGRYVQGGGCLTVGVAGFVQGGGFGSLSKQFSTGAANLLEAEVVTVDGQVVIANATSHPDLFFALKGGGGGTFGIVTRMTVRTHRLPETIGAILMGVEASSDAAWRALVVRLMTFYAEALFNPIWGEQMRFSPGRRFGATMVFHGMTEAQVRETWRPLLTWIEANPADYRFTQAPSIIVAPARRFWDPELLKAIPGLVLGDDRPEAPASNIFWATNRDETGQVLHAYQSAWMPAELLREDRREALVDALVAGSREWSVSLHANKGLAGGSAEALALARDTSTNPDMLGAFALLISAAEGPPAWPGIPGHAPDVQTARRNAAAVARAMSPIRALVPLSGSYVSEADYHDDDWQRRYWGTNYARLLAAKRRYDPTSFLSGHHTVGSG